GRGDGGRRGLRAGQLARCRRDLDRLVVLESRVSGDVTDPGALLFLRRGGARVAEDRLLFGPVVQVHLQARADVEAVDLVGEHFGLRAGRVDLAQRHFAVARRERRRGGVAGPAVAATRGVVPEVEFAVGVGAFAAHRVFDDLVVDVFGFIADVGDEDFARSREGGDAPLVVAEHVVLADDGVGAAVELDSDAGRVVDRRFAQFAEPLRDRFEGR